MVDRRVWLHLAIFLSGILSGAFALGIGWWGEPSLLISQVNASPFLSALLVIAIHLISIASIVGGALIFASSRASRFALLSSSVAWLGLVAVMGHGMTPAMATVILVTAAGGVAGFLAAVREPWVVLRDDVALPPGFNRGSDELRRPKPQRPERTDVAAVSSRREPAFDLSDVDTAWTPQRGDGGPVPALRRHPRGRPARSRARTVAGAIGLGVVVLIGFAIVTLSGDLLSQPTSKVATERPASASNAPLTANATTAVEAERLPRGTADLSSVDLTTASSTEDLGEIGTDLGDNAASALSSGPSATSSASTQVAALPSVDATAIMASNVALSSASASSSAIPTSFSSPDEYCRAIGTTDAPDASRLSDGLAALTTQARTQTGLPQGEVRWRCMNAAVWICVQPAGGLSCDKVPTAVDRVLICAAHPDAKGIRTAAGDWSCDGFTPVVTQAQLSAPDSRGFDRGAWSRLAGPAAATR